MTQLVNIYNNKFFQAYGYEGYSYVSAKEYFAYLFEFYRPNSIVDFGCGIGAWLTAANELGVKDLLGIDGNWIDGKQLNADKIEYKLVDLEQPIKLDRKFDLAISLEVAEHLSEERAKSFISNICASADVVIFSAAVKGQGGVNHINEQWQSYWIDIFSQNNYQCIDLFRSKFWNSETVGFYYAQNAFLFIKRGDERIKLFDQQALEPIYDVSHPRMFARPQYPKYCTLQAYLRTTPRIPYMLAKSILRKLNFKAED
jgi:SAM-dependent methyltransferase